MSLSNDLFYFLNFFINALYIFLTKLWERKNRQLLKKKERHSKHSNSNKIRRFFVFMCLLKSSYLRVYYKYSWIDSYPWKSLEAYGRGYRVERFISSWYRSYCLRRMCYWRNSRLDHLLLSAYSSRIWEVSSTRSFPSSIWQAHVTFLSNKIIYWTVFKSKVNLI